MLIFVPFRRVAWPSARDGERLKPFCISEKSSAAAEKEVLHEGFISEHPYGQYND